MALLSNQRHRPQARGLKEGVRGSSQKQSDVYTNGAQLRRGDQSDLLTLVLSARTSTVSAPWCTTESIIGQPVDPRRETNINVKCRSPGIPKKNSPGECDDCGGCAPTRTRQLCQISRHGKAKAQESTAQHRRTTAESWAVSITAQHSTPGQVHEHGAAAKEEGPCKPRGGAHQGRSSGGLTAAGADAVPPPPRLSSLLRAGRLSCSLMPSCNGPAGGCSPIQGLRFQQTTEGQRSEPPLEVLSGIADPRAQPPFHLRDDPQGNRARLRPAWSRQRPGEAPTRSQTKAQDTHAPDRVRGSPGTGGNASAAIAKESSRRCRARVHRGAARKWLRQQVPGSEKVHAHEAACEHTLLHAGKTSRRACRNNLTDCDEDAGMMPKCNRACYASRVPLRQRCLPTLCNNNEISFFVCLSKRGGGLRVEPRQCVSRKEGWWRLMRRDALGTGTERQKTRAAQHSRSTKKKSERSGAALEWGRCTDGGEWPRGLPCSPHCVGEGKRCPGGCERSHSREEGRPPGPGRATALWGAACPPAQAHHQLWRAPPALQRGGWRWSRSKVRC